MLKSLSKLRAEYNRPASTRNPPPKLLDELRLVLRLHHYSLHPERSSVEWIVRFVRFHGMRSRADLCPAAPTIQSFLTDLAVHGHVAAATQHQAMKALVFLDTRILNNAIKVAVRRAGLPKTISAHTFRHAFATQLLQRGTNIRTIQPLLGHNDVATTMIDTHILLQGGQGVPSPRDDLGV